MIVFQVDTEFITSAYSQPMNLVQTEPELTVQIAKTLFCNDPKLLSQKTCRKAIRGSNPYIKTGV